MHLLYFPPFHNMLRVEQKQVEEKNTIHGACIFYI